MPSWPEAHLPARTYRNHSLDSTRWSAYSPRPGDVVVASSYKSGTTWVQVILLSLFEGRTDVTLDLSPWLDAPWQPLANVLADLDSRRSRRVLKTHIPPDGLPYYEDVSYVVIHRDSRDIFMSLWNQYCHMVRWPFVAAATHPDRVGGPLPACPTDIRHFWHGWITRGWFEWEREGYPFWGNLRNAALWWEVRRTPNVLFVHFNDLLADLSGQIERIAAFLRIEIDPPRLATISGAVEFSAMKQNAKRLLPRAGLVFKGGAARFIHRGKNGQWRNVLTEEDLDQLKSTLIREVPTVCAAWLAEGLRAGGDPRWL